MKKALLFMLTISGLSTLSTKKIKEYHFVKELKTWAEAQSYCRDKFTDLATVENQEDNRSLMSVLKGHGKFAWIGLYDDIKGWKWVLGNADLNNDFSNWRENEPNNVRSRESCTMMTPEGLWVDNICWKKSPAVCYWDRGPSFYILVKTLMNWTEARTYCRSNYTGLVRVWNMSENNNISSLLSGDTWIGLYRTVWAYWSDKTPRTFTNWNKSQPDNSGEKMTSCTAVNTTTGKWWDVDCEEKHHFMCQHVYYPPPQYKTTFRLKFQSEMDLNDPAFQQQIFEQLHAKLEKHGLPDFKLRWIQTDGKTFRKEQKTKKEEGSCG